MIEVNFGIEEIHKENEGLLKKFEDFLERQNFKEIKKEVFNFSCLKNQVFYSIDDSDISGKTTVISLCMDSSDASRNLYYLKKNIIKDFGRELI